MRCVWNTAVVIGILGVAPLAGADGTVGQKAPEWNELPGVDGKSHSLAELKGKPAVLVVFYANSCPDCDIYSERIESIGREFESKGVSTVLINVSLLPDDNFENMKKRAKERKLPGQYLFDESQKIGKQFGAKVTPEAFVLDKDRTVVYRGAIDDHWKPAMVQKHYLREAIAAVLGGKPVPTAQTTAEGCFIEYEK